MGPLAVTAAGFTVLDACSSNGTTTTVVTQQDSGQQTTGDDGGGTTPPGTPPAPPGDDGGGGGDGGDCGSPAKLFPPKPGAVDFYCPFGTSADGGKLYCPLAETCCETPKGGPASSCVAGKTQACPTAGSTAWECEAPSDCPGAGAHCCAHAADAGAVTVQTDTCGPYLSHFSGTTCSATACPAGQLTICEVQSDCAAGTCTAVKPKGNDVGVCN
jgi:hypothetical protein